MRVLIAEDDDAISAGLKQVLVECGYAVDQVTDGQAADRALRDHVYDVLVLDLGLPHLDGVEVVRRARSRGDTTSILIVTARDGLTDRVQLLDLGADDYIVKPFSPIEFAARVRALIRRRTTHGVPIVSVGRLHVDLTARRARIDQTPIELTARESALLEALVARQGRLVSRSQLVEALCNWEQELSDNGLDIALHRLRRKLQDSGASIRTIRGLGYLLEESATEESRLEEDGHNHRDQP